MSVTIYSYSEQGELNTFNSLDKLPNLNENTRIWIDIQEEGSSHLETVAAIYGLHELTVEDCITPGHYPKIEFFDSYTFFILRSLVPLSTLPDILDEDEETQIEEEEGYTRPLGVYLSEKFIITYRKHEVSWLDAVVRQVKQHPDKVFSPSNGVLVHRIIDVLVDRFQRGMKFFEKTIHNLEEVVLEDPYDFQMSQVLELKRELVELRQIVHEQKLVIGRLITLPFLREDSLQRYFTDVQDHMATIINTIDKQVDGLLGVRDAFFANANVRLGDTMRIVAVLTLIAVPLNLMVGIFGMNFDLMPLLHNPNGFWVIFTLLLIITVGMLIYFRRKRWL